MPHYWGGLASLPCGRVNRRLSIRRWGTAFAISRCSRRWASRGAYNAFTGCTSLALRSIANGGPRSGQTPPFSRQNALLRFARVACVSLREAFFFILVACPAGELRTPCMLAGCLLEAKLCSRG